jgi:trk system potassium uptake protein TrkH
LFLEKLEAAIRHALFQVVAIVTTTGFVSADYIWLHFLVVFFFGMMFLEALLEVHLEE